VDFDLLIRGGLIVDGSGRTPAHPADIGIRGDRIAAIGPLPTARAATVVDAAGHAVAPGFIDVHVHSEIALLGGPHRYGGVLQGVTTHLTAPDGFGWAPLAHDRAQELWEATEFAYGKPYADLALDWPTPEAYLDIFRGNTPANVVPQVPHCAVRLAAMGWEARAARPEEIEAMRAGVRRWLEAGAVCLCLGLEYQPSAYADTRELIELSKVAAEYGAIYAAHIRIRESSVQAAWRETMEIGREAGIPVHISHTAVNDVTEPLLEEAARTCDLTIESYMYPASCTHLVMMLPNWAQGGGPAGIRRRLRDSEARKQMAAALEDHLLAGSERGARAVFAANQTGRYIGMSVPEAAEAAGLPLGEFALRTLEEESPYALMVYHQGGTPAEHAALVRRTFRHPRMMVASDGIYHGQRPHPRGYGCFARALRLGVRELGAVSLEEAVHRMTAFPAERFRIPDRGLLKEGYAADVVVFDPASVADGASFEEPYAEPVGVDAVLVGGQVVVDHGRPTGRLPGRVLRRA
jgi:N-acyl-D-amino-acid deacylase